jgi:preflagellin peptidase FlaK
VTEFFDFDLIRIVVALVMLALASYFDLKKREVSDMLWIVFAVAAGIFYVFDYPTSMDEAASIMISMALTAAISYGIYRSGLFGGADMLALITLSGFVPLYNPNTLFSSGGVVFHSFAPLIVLTNAIILSSAHVVFNVARNLAYSSKHPGLLFEGLQHEPTSRKILAMLVGHRSQNPQYSFPIERSVSGRREFDFSLKPAETAAYEVRKDVWVTSGIPYLIYITVGLILMILMGDLLATIAGGLLSW